MKMKAYMNWSGGKDSSLALWKVMHDSTYHVQALLTSMNSHFDRVSMHGVRRSLIEAQAKSIGLPLYTLELPEQPSMKEYEQAMMKGVQQFTHQAIHQAIFGDIFLEDLKKYREEQLAKLHVNAVFPLWAIDTPKLMHTFIEEGFKAIVVCVNGNVLDESFCGRIIDQSFVDDLPEGVDVCGENGEYHSFVFDGPIFNYPVPFNLGEKIHRIYKSPNSTSGQDVCHEQIVEENKGFYFIDLLPK
jgi:uncharacterized protein (TIGR00290 family)